MMRCMLGTLYDRGYGEFQNFYCGSFLVASMPPRVHLAGNAAGRVIVRTR